MKKHSISTSPNHVFIIAEAGVNHNGSVALAKKLIDIAAEAGADAIKFQTYKTEELLSKNAPKAAYQNKNTPLNESQFEMLKNYELDSKAHYELFKYSQRKKISFISSPFDNESIDLLSQIGVDFIKIASGEIINAPLLLKASRTHIPIILSTGMATLGEIESALSIIAFGRIHESSYPTGTSLVNTYHSSDAQNILKENVSILHCTTDYPASFEHTNLHTIRSLSDTFGLKTGFSDHTKGIAISIAAVACGARIIEKHITTDKTLPGPDHSASIEPNDLKNMVLSIRQVEKSLGSIQKQISTPELTNRLIVRKSIMASRKIKKGDIFTDKNLLIKRPGNGISPLKYWDLIGKTSSKSYNVDDLIID
ncbi:MAG: N-acetylneuraminate synthase [Desulfobacterales bacterium]|nr:N-acetylneuraminate synthase [Desulfobacterales bacterium]